MELDDRHPKKSSNRKAQRSKEKIKEKTDETTEEKRTPKVNEGCELSWYRVERAQWLMSARDSNLSTSDHAMIQR